MHLKTTVFLKIIANATFIPPPMPLSYPPYATFRPPLNRPQFHVDMTRGSWRHLTRKSQLGTNKSDRSPPSSSRLPVSWMILRRCRRAWP